MKTIDTADLLPPGAFVEEELEARGWSQQDLADILKRPPRLVSELINGKRAITVETARGLSNAFGTSVELWLNLQRDFEIARSRPREPDRAAEEDAVVRRARLYSLLPIREMARRGWIAEVKEIVRLEAGVCKFAVCSNVDALEEALPHAARKSGATELSPQQRAWLLRARQLGRIPVPGVFSQKAMPGVYQALKRLVPDVAEIQTSANCWVMPEFVS
jgi:HTH-type transcriptional regulator / antitoxin HigA